MLLNDPVGRAASTRRGIRHVALAFPMDSTHLHQVVHGITEFAARQQRWAFTTFPEPLGETLAQIGWRGHGVITAMTRSQDVRAASELGLPCVNISGALWDDSFPRVNIDNLAVGRLAAEHLLARGFRRFACYAVRGVRYSDERERGFLQRLRQAKVPGEIATLRRSAAELVTEREELDALTDWLARLEHPVALFAVTDERARMVLDACEALGRRVPDQVAVIGVDNDLLTCTSCTPPLSSIACDWRRIGFESAAMLDRLMDSDSSAPAEVLIPPIDIAARRSTDVMVLENLSVARAVEYVRTHISEVFGVEALLAETGVPRRSLELAFKRSMGCTPYEFIIRARVSRAMELLSSERPGCLTAIASACGFGDLRRFRLVFRRETNQSPREYAAAQRAMA
jgi:LacI family transcriptional regulator